MNENKLFGKHIVEFACGEGGAAAILCGLGCIYTGADCAPSALGRTAETIAGYPDATLLRLDLTRERLEGVFDAALDIMGLHMLVTDSDRAAYLANMRACRLPGVPALFLFENYRENFYSGDVKTLDDWINITGESDYTTPRPRTVKSGGKDITVEIPFLPSRPKTRDGYIEELERAGFAVVRFEVCKENPYCSFAAHIYARRI